MRTTVDLWVIDCLKALTKGRKAQLGLAHGTAEAAIVVKLPGPGFEPLHGIDLAAATATHDARLLLHLSGHCHNSFLSVAFSDAFRDAVNVVIVRRHVLTLLYLHRAAERHNATHRRRPLAVLLQDLLRVLDTLLLRHPSRDGPSSSTMTST